MSPQNTQNKHKKDWNDRRFPPDGEGAGQAKMAVLRVQARFERPPYSTVHICIFVADRIFCRRL